MPPPPASRSPILTIVVLLVAGALFVTVTAMQGASTISISAPSADTMVRSGIALVFGEMFRRGLRKLDKIGLKCDRTHERLEKVDTALRGYDGNGGALEDIRQLQDGVAELQRGRGVAVPAGFNISPAPARAVTGEKK